MFYIKHFMMLYCICNFLHASDKNLDASYKRGSYKKKSFKSDRTYTYKRGPYKTKDSSLHVDENKHVIYTTIIELQNKINFLQQQINQLEEINKKLEIKINHYEKTPNELSDSLSCMEDNDLSDWSWLKDLE